MKVIKLKAKVCEINEEQMEAAETSDIGLCEKVLSFITF